MNWLKPLTDCRHYSKLCQFLLTFEGMMANVSSKIFLFLLYLLPSQLVNAQGRDFWFAAPEVIQRHADRPIFLRISTYDQPAVVTISQPANPAFAAITVSMPPNSLQTIDLTKFIDAIETKPANTVLKTGLHIVSSSEISTYYEVLGKERDGDAANTDIFVLKGNAALGNLFFIPMQNHWDNFRQLDAWSSFDIVATEDNTNISITPTQELVGHKKGVTFTITLNKGETYSATAYNSYNDRGFQRSFQHATASKVVSDKPIAITYKDDSIFESPSYDLAGDQLIPVENTGKEYIAIKASGNLNLDRLFICPIKDSTKLFIKNDTLLLNTFSTYNYQLIDSSVYISSSSPIYVFHISGFGKELGGAILPPLKCTGSKSVAFVRSNSEKFGLNILAKSGSEGDFTINGSNKNIPSSLFKTVSGTDGKWKYAQLIFEEEDSDVFEPEKTYIIKNSRADFHLGTLNGGEITGFRYGYFSGFGEVNLLPKMSLCQGDSLVIDAGQNKDSYQWNFQNATTPFITVKDTGRYWVQVTKGECTFSDTTQVVYNEPVSETILGKDTSACANVTISISAEHDFSSYTWQNGSKSKTITPLSTGTYILRVTNQYGCQKSDSLFFRQLPVPQPQIVIHTSLEQFCSDSIVKLSLSREYDSYKWFNGEANSSIATKRNVTDEYTVYVTDSGCANSGTIQLDCSPFLYIPNVFTPNNDNVNDQFRIQNLNPTIWRLEVHNRWGKQVYISEPYENNWDGSGLPDGIYYYQLTNTKENRKQKGWMEIIR